MIGDTKRRAAAIAVAITAAMAMVIVASPPVSADVGSSISGTVTDGVSPIANATVEAIDQVGNRYPAKTAGDGTYVLSDLPNQVYTVKFAAPGFQHEFYDDAPVTEEATTLQIVGSTDHTGIDAALDTPPELSGTVTDEATGDPLAGIKVDLYRGQRRMHTTFTEADGTWEVVGFPTGTYGVRFVDTTETYVREWWDGVQYVGGAFADPVVVAPGAVIGGIDASLQEAIPGSLSGTVTDEVTGLPISRVPVLVYDQFGRKTLTRTAADGTWSIEGLFPSMYTINFRGKSGLYVPEWYDDKPSKAASDEVLVAIDSDVVGIDAVMTPVGA